MVGCEQKVSEKAIASLDNEEYPIFSHGGDGLPDDLPERRYEKYTAFKVKRRFSNMALFPNYISLENDTVIVHEPKKDSSLTSVKIISTGSLPEKKIH
ncbi:hypothetical protein GCM10027443_34560 [Pontibacter brevis]